MSSETDKMDQGLSSLHCTSVILFMCPIWSKKSCSSEQAGAHMSHILTDSAEDSRNLPLKGQNRTDRMGSVWPSNVCTTGLSEACSVVVRLAISIEYPVNFLMSLTHTFLLFEPVAIRFGLIRDQSTVLISSMCTFRSLLTGPCSWIFCVRRELTAGMSRPD